VRHPIYSGFMLATLGTAVMQGELHGLLALALIVTEPLANSQINVSTRPSLNAVNARRAPLV
jgi:protein-S-isoprenylcysteine O-methyltransferase Ste14